LAGIPNFRQQRVTAERQARQRQDDYQLAHIYEVLARASGLQPQRCQELMELELEAERQFAQPVRANLDRLEAGDLVISDMYLSADQMRLIARPHINLDRHPFLVSSSGKQQGRVWRKLRQAGIEARHRGDNVIIR
jgi:predicted HAD superfamily hydrolase